MNNVKASALATILAGLIALFAPAGVADAAPAVKSAGTSVCDTGYRGNPEYDRMCLRTGTFRDGALMWLSMPAGHRGHETRNMEDRRSVCKFAGQYGGIRPAVREIFNDVAYDRYTNYRTVLTYAGAVASLDCKSMGYKI